MAEHGLMGNKAALLLSLSLVLGACGDADPAADASPPDAAVGADAGSCGAGVLTGEVAFGATSR